MRRWLQLLTIVGVMGAGAATPGRVGAIAFVRPVFVQNPFCPSNPSNNCTVELRWKTDTNAPVTVNYGISTSYGLSKASDTVNGGVGGGSNNHVLITGLAPNTKYYYQLVGLTNAGDTGYYFKTPPIPGSTTPFKFAVLGDPGHANSNQRNVANHMNTANPDLFMIAGDVVYDYSDPNPEYNDARLFDIYTNTMRRAPYYGACGNHDDDGNCSQLVADQSLPATANKPTEAAFSWDFGNAHFVVADSNRLTTTQNDWVKNNLLASNKPWKVVIWHHNGWSQGSHISLDRILTSLVRASNDGGADLVIWGHSHVFERWNRDSSYPNVQMYTIGNGGSRSTSACTSTSPGPGCAAKSSGEAGFLLAEVNGDQMTIRYMTENGAVTDTLSLNSGGPGPTSPPTTPTRTPTPGSATPTRTPTPSRTPTPGPTVPPGSLLGDANGDCVVDGVDYVIWLNHFGQTIGGGASVGDFNLDGRVDGVDYVIWLNNFGRTCS